MEKKSANSEQPAPVRKSPRQSCPERVSRGLRNLLHTTRDNRHFLLEFLFRVALRKIMPRTVERRLGKRQLRKIFAHVLSESVIGHRFFYGYGYDPRAPRGYSSNICGTDATGGYSSFLSREGRLVRKHRATESVRIPQGHEN